MPKSPQLGEKCGYGAAIKVKVANRLNNAVVSHPRSAKHETDA
jgi:hypothetical protein